MSETCVMPEGMRWCPDCNGEGQVSVMQAHPPWNEDVYDCTTCVDGLVPTEGRDTDVAEGGER